MTADRRAAEALVALVYLKTPVCDACEIGPHEHYLLCDVHAKLADAILAYGAQCRAEARAETMRTLSAAMKKTLHPDLIDLIAMLSLIHISEPTRLLSISYAVFC